jgi:hypothetical protein
MELISDMPQATWALEAKQPPHPWDMVGSSGRYGSDRIIRPHPWPLHACRLVWGHHWNAGLPCIVALLFCSRQGQEKPALDHCRKMSSEVVDSPYHFEDFVGNFDDHNSTATFLSFTHPTPHSALFWICGELLPHLDVTGDVDGDGDGRDVSCTVLKMASRGRQRVQRFLGVFIENINSARMTFIEQPPSFAIREREKEPVSDPKANIGFGFAKGVVVIDRLPSSVPNLDA